MIQAKTLYQIERQASEGEAELHYLCYSKRIQQILGF